MPPERRGSRGIYTPTPLQSRVRAAPGGVNSSLLSPREGKKMHLLTDGNPPGARWTGKTQGMWVISLGAMKAKKGKTLQKKRRQERGIAHFQASDYKPASSKHAWYKESPEAC